MARGSQSQQRRRSARRAARREELGLKNAPDPTTVAPTVTGTTTGEVLAADVGVWTGNPAEIRVGTWRSDDRVGQDALAAIAALAEAPPSTMPCADCGHQFAMHDGACNVQGCSCDAFAEEAAETEEAAAEQNALTTRVALVFTSVDGQMLPTTDLDEFRAYIAEHPESVSFATVADLPVAPTELPARTPGPVLADPPSTGGGMKKWQAILAPEGSPTDDGRIFAPGSMTWRELPITLMAMIETQDGHTGAQVSGRIDRIWRDESGMLMGEGVFDVGEFGQEIARMVADGTLRGVSVDIAVSEMDVLPRSEILDENGAWRDGVTRDTVEQASSDPLDIFVGDPGDVLFVVWEGVIGAATVCPFPAFGEATIALAASLVAGAGTPPHVWTVTSQAGWRVTSGPDSLTAAAADDDGPDFVAEIERQIAEDSLTAAAAGLAPVAPPSSWFANPELTELTPLVVTDDGHVYGHAAAWDVCHIGLPGVCVTAPTARRSRAAGSRSTPATRTGTCRASRPPPTTTTPAPPSPTSSPVRTSSGSGLRVRSAPASTPRRCGRSAGRCCPATGAT
jgi:hypothetical protein